jgi:hypothetical protein
MTFIFGSHLENALKLLKTAFVFAIIWKIKRKGIYFLNWAAASHLGPQPKPARPASSPPPTHLRARHDAPDLG